MPFGKNAGPSYIRSVPSPSQIGITNGAASLNDGFPPLTFQPVGSGGIPPYGQDFNGILNQITAWNQWQQAGGQVMFDSTFVTNIGGYPQWSILASSSTVGLLWLNTVDNNTTNPDGGGASGWIAWGPSGQFLHYGTDTGSANTLTVSSVTPIVGTVITGMLFEITKVSSVNTAAMTGTISGTSGSIVWGDGTALRANDWPASSTGLLYYDGSNFRLLTSFIRASAFSPSATVNFYVNGALGNDLNDGLANTSGHAFLTAQGAINAIASRYLSLNTANVYFADGTYSGGMSFNASGIANWNMVGNVSTPGNCVITATSTGTNSGRGVLAYKGTSVAIQGFAFSSYYENVSANGGYVNVKGCNISAPSSTYAGVTGLNGGQLQLSGTITYSGAFAALVFTYSSGIVTCGYYDASVSLPVTFAASGTPSFSVGFAESLNGGTISFYPTVTTFTGTSTGPRYYANMNGTVYTYGQSLTYLPGNASGTLVNGGQYG